MSSSEPSIVHTAKFNAVLQEDSDQKDTNSENVNDIEQYDGEDIDGRRTEQIDVSLSLKDEEKSSDMKLSGILPEHEIVDKTATTSSSLFSQKPKYIPISASQEEDNNEMTREVNSSTDSMIKDDENNMNDSHQAPLAFAQRAERDYMNIRNAIDMDRVSDESQSDILPSHPNVGTHTDRDGRFNDDDDDNNNNPNNPSSNGINGSTVHSNNDNNTSVNTQDTTAREMLLQLARDLERLLEERVNDNDDNNNTNNGANNDRNINNNYEVGMFERHFNTPLLRRIISLNHRKHPFRDFLIFMYIISSIVVSLIAQNEHCEPSLRIWIIIMGVYLFIRCTLYSTSRYLKRFIIQAELDGNHDPYIWIRRLYTFELRLMELLDVFGVITFCVGNLMIIRAQQCYHDAPISTWSGFVLVILTNCCLLHPFFRKMCALCFNDTPLHDPNGSEIPPALRLHLSRSREDVKRAWTQWLETNGSRSFDYCPEAVRDESCTEYTYTHGDEEAACPICLVDFKGCDNVRVQSFPCPSRHIFHEECLLDFLYSVSGRDTMPTCPCCRASAGERRERSRSGTEEAPIAASVDDDTVDQGNGGGDNNCSDGIIDENSGIDHVEVTINSTSQVEAADVVTSHDMDDIDDVVSNDQVVIDVIEGVVSTSITATDGGDTTSDGFNHKSLSPLLSEEPTICCEIPTEQMGSNNEYNDVLIAPDKEKIAGQDVS